LAVEVKGERMSEAETTPEPLLVDAQGVAAMLGIGRTHLYALNSSGRLPLPIRLGRRTLWRRDELTAWVAAGCPARDRWQTMKGARA
jgi:excisionase family DNA binding protein